MDEQSGSKQLRTLNFDTITRQYVDITKDGRTWHLRDDVPSEVMLRMFVASSLQSIQARLTERFEAEAKRLAALSPEEAARENSRQVARRAMQEEVQAGQLETFDILGEIIRHTPAYAHVSTEELSGTYDAGHWRWVGGLFTLDEAEQICQLFFQLRSLRLSEQRNAQRPETPEAAAQAQQGTGSSSEELH